MYRRTKLISLTLDNIALSQRPGIYRMFSSAPQLSSGPTHCKGPGTNKQLPQKALARSCHNCGGFQQVLKANMANCCRPTSAASILTIVRSAMTVGIALGRSLLIKIRQYGHVMGSRLKDNSYHRCSGFGLRPSMAQVMHSLGSCGCVPLAE